MTNVLTLRPKFTRSQTELLGLARDPIASSREVDLVKICDDCAGVSFAAKWAMRESRGNTQLPRSLHLEAFTKWDATKSLLTYASLKGGSGYIDCLMRSLTVLSGDIRRPLCLWLDRAGRMPVVDQEEFGAMVEWVADRLEIRLRLVYLMNRTLVWHERDESHSKRKHYREHRISACVAKRARKFEFTAEGFEELVHGALFGAEQAAPAVQEPAVAVG